jgi:hypothetical protein
MSAFDMTVRVGNASVVLVEADDGNDKAVEAQMILGVLALAPIQPGQALPIPLGQLRVPLDKASIDALISELQQASGQMRERSSVAVAHDLSEVERAAKFHQGLR